MIKATIIADSVTPDHTRITTFELEYPRFIHSELMTHRMFSRNAASSRAIPIKAMHELVLGNPATPVHWGTNKPGMQAGDELVGVDLSAAKYYWSCAARAAVSASADLDRMGLHKQIANRVTEPFQIMKTVVTATEWDNWYYLRNHEDAQPEIHELAKAMYEAHTLSTPNELQPGEWHVPYVHTCRDLAGTLLYLGTQGDLLTVEQAQQVSASCCAQVSYRKNDDSLEKAQRVFDRLVNSEPMHASPIEHQATPMKLEHTHIGDTTWESGITHVDRFGCYWSGNLRGWIQFRQIFEA